jgi:carbonic anhydrase/acetyltransferase-like protein (isoleucine patch superfamily)|tara:strand:+ start:38 stop:568 length:531 start_codon:yes stop_codon:yes gene_type:complete
MIFGSIYNYKDKRPLLGANVFVAPSAVIIGDVRIAKECSVWFQAVIRGDVNKIRIGGGTNIQDSVIIHVTTKGSSTIIGSNVTIGHGAIVHACTVRDRSLIGMGSILMDDVVVESNALVAAGSLVTEGKRVKKGEVWAGSPAVFVRYLTKKESKFIETSSRRYQSLAQEYKGITSQ